MSRVPLAQRKMSRVPLAQLWHLFGWRSKGRDSHDRSYHNTKYEITEDKLLNNRLKRRTPVIAFRKTRGYDKVRYDN